ncbi:hypothetical protein A3B87_00515 [Candidatus Kuenenbacteria bacterium RIFCSPHIGHO2_02_FULL_39_13]|uniref:DUF5666 domain-containing protein n=1 Tax=Candidatus Kuenenbacteria bacterium RIFCSPHIGHO2_02_FULL_39_13 TaxID=1798561 RepID=A0A1F6FNZ6_9BACT|nr:MAG: hypothetical protein A3B87_00515 [Candidatus Kuenenbacteria bacterium RIFCSPHIGHO2_02_FULL_39_13]
MNKKIVPIIIAVIIVAGAGGFFGGIKYGQSKKTSTNNPMPRNFQLNNDQTQRGMGGIRSNANFIAGSVIAKDDKSLTIKLPDGGSKIIFYSVSTEIMKTATGTLEELKVGDTVMASGTANQDGSITAQSIQLRPEMPSMSAN